MQLNSRLVWMVRWRLPDWGLGVCVWHLGHEGLVDDHLVAGIPKVAALLAAGGEITANTGEYLSPGQFAKAAGAVKIIV